MITTPFLDPAESQVSNTRDIAWILQYLSDRSSDTLSADIDNETDGGTDTKDDRHGHEQSWGRILDKSHRQACTRSGYAKHPFHMPLPEVRIPK